ncbi:hypothetical protein SAPIO_CDS7809 [Scedosporium apiospermum]|uniref:Uncharacterized protein n=1 Tax=Pseudallescheria apiosperma TaxID=563466 RepID=A0A084G0Q5_PSEDA|nr:uncharacterized protein SAPIO_CDS7809 [Scedosporium apiospermum]KEZ40917.1 hypothetical protein SAPIO_CDS7809 [Scedosporium apiospermum]
MLTGEWQILLAKADFFYVCVAHLKDRNFCTPIIDQAAIDAKKKKELDEEVERVKKEYEERKKKKEEEKKKKEEEEKGKEKSKDDKGKEKEKDKDKDKDKESSEGDKKNDKSDDSKAGSPTPTAEEPRVFALHRTFYQQRVEKRRQMEIAKRNRERLQQPNYFPSVPKGLPGA